MSYDEAEAQEIRRLRAEAAEWKRLYERAESDASARWEALQERNDDEAGYDPQFALLQQRTAEAAAAHAELDSAHWLIGVVAHTICEDDEEIVHAAKRLKAEAAALRDALAELLDSTATEDQLVATFYIPSGVSAARFREARAVAGRVLGRES